MSGNCKISCWGSVGRLLMPWSTSPRKVSSTETLLQGTYCWQQTQSARCVMFTCVKSRSHCVHLYMEGVCACVHLKVMLFKLISCIRMCIHAYIQYCMVTCIHIILYVCMYACMQLHKLHNICIINIAIKEWWCACGVVNGWSIMCDQLMFLRSSKSASFCIKYMYCHRKFPAPMKDVSTEMCMDC